jgi:hypothetical protein
MTSVHEPVLHALSVEPRVARPGETVSVIFRTRNRGTAASPPAGVAFLLGDGLEALDAREVAVESVAPGEDVVATLRARVNTPLDDRTELALQATLHVPGAVLGTNVCTLVVRSRPVFGGAASGTFVEAIGADRVGVRAVVTNEGDGAARDVRVVVPAPAGCVRADGDGAAVFAVERLEAGASVTVAFEARIVEPVGVLQAHDAEVHFGTGCCSMLPVREVVVMEPVLAMPVVAVDPARRSVDVAIDVANVGWVDARDVRVRIALPPPLRAVDGSISVDGVPVAARGRRSGGDPPFARAERTGGAHVVVLAVPARTTARVTLAATFPGGYAGGAIVVSAGAHEVAVPFEPETVRDVRMRLIELPRRVAPGGDVRVVAEIVNAGDLAEALFCCIAGAGIVVVPEAVSRTVAPGSVALVELAVRVQPAVAGDVPLQLSVVACDEQRERARCDFAVAVRDYAAACCDEPVGPEAEDMPAVVHAALHGPDEAAAGASFAIRLQLDVEDDVDTLALRLAEVPSAIYVPGSASLDGRALLDRGGASPFAGDGLILRGVRGGTRVTATCLLLASPAACDETLIVAAEMTVDGEERPCAPVAVHVRGRDAFAPQPAGLRYHVDACVIESSPNAGALKSAPDAGALKPAQDAGSLSEVAELCVTEAPLPAWRSGAYVEPELVPSAVLLPVTAMDDDAFAFVLRLDAQRRDAIARLLHGAAGTGLLGHALAVRALFPDSVTSVEGDVAAALDGVRTALRDVFDRLFVKLRIPGFDVACDDLDDVVLRGAMAGFFEALLDASPGRRDGRSDDGCGEGDGATARITRERVRELLTGFAGAPYGDPAVLRALVALVPTRCESNPLLGAALARYACAFDDVLARYDGVPLELFDDALARASDRALDDARAELAAALGAREAFAPFAEAAC